MLTVVDVRSGILRKLWTFREGAKVPSRTRVKELLPYVGWGKVEWDGKTIRVPEGMEVDFGGFAKEYAVDMALELAGESYDCPVLVNFGGDLAANRQRESRDSWSVGVRQAANEERVASFKFKSGAIATSGNRYRYLYHKGKKLTHILNPHTGWPVSHAPVSVSVAMSTCLEAGFLSTLASLMGKNAEDFLAAQEVEHWVQR